MPPGARAADALGKEPVTLSGSALSFEAAPYDLKMIRLAAEAPQ